MVKVRLYNVFGWGSNRNQNTEFIFMIMKFSVSWLFPMRPSGAFRPCFHTLFPNKHIKNIILACKDQMLESCMCPILQTCICLHLFGSILEPTHSCSYHLSNSAMESRIQVPCAKHIQTWQSIMWFIGVAKHTWICVLHTIVNVANRGKAVDENCLSYLISIWP